MLAPVLALFSCSPDSGYSEYERTAAAFMAQLDGDVCPTHWWKTAVTLNVHVETAVPVKIWVMSESNGGKLYDYREVSESGLVKMSVPQGMGTTVYLVTVAGRTKDSQAVTLTGKSEESVELAVRGLKSEANARRQVDLQRQDDTGWRPPMAAPSDNEPDPVASSLWGNSVNGNGFLMELNKQQCKDYLEMMSLLSLEGLNAKTDLGLNVDYELESKGTFTITWIAGDCSSNTPHVLGYYYHSPGTYSDITYVDLCETELYDVIDGYAKVQYQVNADAVAKYPEDNLKVGKWYAANFDINDRWDRENPCLPARKGDNAWNTMAVFKRYGNSICAMRGVTFEIDVPAGMRVGFYNRADNDPRPEQYDRLVKHKVKPYTDREHFKGTNYSAEAMNSYYEKGDFRSFIEPLKDMMWMGMENQIGGGDLDCNDVIFGVTAKMDIYLPGVVEPDLYPTGEYDSRMVWTIAYEDLARHADFDFNDAVIRLSPDYEAEECCVTIEAAGAEQRMYLHYDGPEGDVNLGEIHELLGKKVGTKVNTTTSVAQTPFVQIDCVPWPKEYTMANDAKRFWIEIQRGTCEDCTDMITLATGPGQVPQAMLIAGEWKWPMEGVHIFSAYNYFPNWAKDVSKISYWDWYVNAIHSKVVSF